MSKSNQRPGSTGAKAGPTFPPQRPRAPDPELSGFAEVFAQILDGKAETDPALKARLAERFIPLRWTGVTSRVFSFWRAEGLIDLPGLPEGREREAVRLTIAEFLHVRLLATLRLFGMGTEALARTQAHLLAAITVEQYLEDAGLSASDPDPFMAAEFADAKKKLGPFFATREQGGSLAHLLLISVAFREPIWLHVYWDGEATTEICGQIHDLPLRTHHPRVVIDFTVLIAELALRLEQEGEGAPIGLLSEAERRILTAIRQSGTSGVEVRISRDGQPVHLTTHMSATVAPEELAQVFAEIKGIAHGQVEIKSNSGQSFYYTISLHERLGPAPVGAKGPARP